MRGEVVVLGSVLLLLVFLSRLGQKSSPVETCTAEAAATRTHAHARTHTHTTDEIHTSEQ